MSALPVKSRTVVPVTLLRTVLEIPDDKHASKEVWFVHALSSQHPDEGAASLPNPR